MEIKCSKIVRIRIQSIVYGGEDDCLPKTCPFLDVSFHTALNDFKIACLFIAIGIPDNIENRTNIVHTRVHQLIVFGLTR